MVELKLMELKCVKQLRVMDEVHKIRWREKKHPPSLIVALIKRVLRDLPANQF